MKIIKHIVAIVSFVLMAGCAATSGSMIDWDKARQVKAGMSQQEVTNLMGAPYSVSSKGEGQQTWVWVYINGWSGASQSAVLNFQNGKVVKAFEIPDSFH